MTRHIAKKKWEYQKLFIMIQLILSPVLGGAIIALRNWHTMKPSRICNVSLDMLGMFILIILFLTCIRDRDDNTFRSGCFAYLVSFNAWALLLDLISWCVDEQPDFILWNMLDNEFFYIAGAATMMMFWNYLVELSGSNNPKLDRITRNLNLLGMVSIAFVIGNFRGHYYFSVDQNGNYDRGTWYLGSQIFLVVMMIYFVIMITKMDIAKEKKAALMSFVSCPVIAMIIQVLVYGISIVNIGVLCALVLIYGNVFSEQNKELALQKIDNLEKEKELLLAKNEKEQLETELRLASEIQTHVLPANFAPLSGHKEFTLHATMTPAKEVGGDFYDFFQADDEHIALVMADVSGKGIPAALYMMVAKTMLKNACKQGLSPKEILTFVNDQLCETVEDVTMFVTVWLGIIEMKTGKGLASNAGHEYPAICKKGGVFELLEDHHSLALGGMEGIRYKEYEFFLHPGDTLFLYTDGVTEAINPKEEMFGTKRMLMALNEMPHEKPDVLLAHMLASIRSFAGGAAQFDDITMMAYHMEESGE